MTPKVEKHALFSASSLYVIARCAGALAMQAGSERFSSTYADEGSAAHVLGKWVVQGRLDALRSGFGKHITAHSYIGQVISVKGSKNSPVRRFLVDATMADYVDGYADHCMSFVSDPENAWVESVVTFAEYMNLDPEDGWGTGDFGSLIEDAPAVYGEEDELDIAQELFPAGQTELVIIDLKYGGGVTVYAKENEQGRGYALGWLAELALAYDIDRVRIIIYQPRKDHIDEEIISVADLIAWGKEFGKGPIAKAKAALKFADRFPSKEVATQLNQAGFLVPGDKQCKFCNRKTDCPARVSQVIETSTGKSGKAADDEFSDLSPAKLKARIEAASPVELGLLMDKAPMIDDFFRSVRAEVDRRLYKGEAVPSPDGGYMLTTGREGDRKYKDEIKAKIAIRKFGVNPDAEVKITLKSPPIIEKELRKNLKGNKDEADRIWNKFANDHITRAPGKPHVVLISEGKPPYKLVQDNEFEDLTKLTDETCDLA